MSQGFLLETELTVVVEVAHPLAVVTVEAIALVGAVAADTDIVVALVGIGLPGTKMLVAEFDSVDQSANIDSELVDWKG